MPSSMTLQHAIENITIWRKGEQRAPHKPLLLLYVLSQYQRGHARMFDYARKHGLTVNKISLKPGSGITQPLFADAWKLAENDISSAEPDDDDPEEIDNEQRDLLGGMEITARLIITGGELKKDARLTRSDRALIREAILHAARLTSREKRQTLTLDIRDALFTLAQDAALPESRRNRQWEMGEAMNMFCSGFEGELFNREGEAGGRYHPIGPGDVCLRRVRSSISNRLYLTD